MSLFDLLRRTPATRKAAPPDAASEYRGEAAPGADPRMQDPELEGPELEGPQGANPPLEDNPLDDAAEPVIPPPRLALSQAAVERIREMIADEGLEEEGGLRIAARTGAGCSAPMLFNLVLETEPREDDVVLEGPGIRLFMDPVSAWSLDGLEVDWVDAPGLGEGFAFRHPRGAGGRAC